MPCLKTFTITAHAGNAEYPLHDATYVPAPVDKIFGTSGPYVIKFNATTGAVEDQVRLSSPMYGDCRICYHAGTGMLFAAGHNEINNKWFSLSHPSREVWQLNPTTLVVTPLNVGSWLTNFEFNNTGDKFGPQWIKAYGNDLYFQYEDRNLGFYWARVNASNFADHNMGGVAPITPMNTEQFEAASGFVYHIQPRYGKITESTTTGVFNQEMFLSVPGPEYQYPVTAIQQGNLDLQLYLVCGNSDFIRIDNFGAGLFTVFGLGAARNPVRLKFLSDNKCYMPSMSTDEIIVWDTVAMSAVYKTGFSNPVDVVETPTKKWAVQNSPTGLREII